ncbi:MAG: polymerase sigma factor [Verrucomicrobiales bacterium]|nr:polymerase sigma factor [Verrucomicrobiales bacterium]
MDTPIEVSECIRVDDLRNLVGELRMMARRFLVSENTHSFTPTALAMTALRRAKLTDQDWTEVRWENRAHFFSALNTAMRHALIDHARRKRAKGRENILYFAPDEDFFRDLPSQAEDRPERFIIVEEALSRLAAEDQRLAETVQHFYFLGYTIPEMASLSGLSEKTIDRDLKKARTLLRKYLDGLLRAA